MLLNYYFSWSNAHISEAVDYLDHSGARVRPQLYASGATGELRRDEMEHVHRSNAHPEQTRGTSESEVPEKAIEMPCPAQSGASGARLSDVARFNSHEG